jgi:two-component system, chemotaxis family, protein-glutamate methylesterase/glutaminase
MTTAPPTRVVVADDSGLMRRVLTHALSDAGFEVVGQAKDGDEALELCRRLRPDTMTLDLHMPGMDGIGVLRELKRPGAPSIPVIVVSAFSPAHGARAVDALSEGAFDLVAKPGAGDALSAFVAELSDKVRAAAGSLRRRVARPVTPKPAPAPAPAPPAPGRVGPISRPRVAAIGSKPLVFIASSTGGPAALARLVPQLPAPLGAGTVVVQHMPAGFTTSLAARLDKASKLDVVEAKAGDTLAPDKVLLGPGGLHLRLDSERRAFLSDEDPIGGLRPRADLAIEDAAKLFGRRLLLVVLTGMGNDGVAGARAVRAHGGRVLIQEESTCTVYGMPRAVAEAGLADAVHGLDELPAAIAREVGA